MLEEDEATDSVTVVSPESPGLASIETIANEAICALDPSGEGSDEGTLCKETDNCIQEVVAMGVTMQK